jgi:hypothetical protein
MYLQIGMEQGKWNLLCQRGIWALKTFCYFRLLASPDGFRSYLFLFVSFVNISAQSLAVIKKLITFACVELFETMVKRSKREHFARFYIVTQSNLSSL